MRWLLFIGFVLSLVLLAAADVTHPGHVRSCHKSGWVDHDTCPMILPSPSR